MQQAALRNAAESVNNCNYVQWLSGVASPSIRAPFAPFGVPARAPVSISDVSVFVYYWFSFFISFSFSLFVCFAVCVLLVFRLGFLLLSLGSCKLTLFFFFATREALAKRGGHYIYWFFVAGWVSFVIHFFALLWIRLPCFACVFSLRHLNFRVVCRLFVATIFIAIYIYMAIAVAGAASLTRFPSFLGGRKCATAPHYPALKTPRFAPAMLPTKQKVKAWRMPCKTCKRKETLKSCGWGTKKKKRKKTRQ